MSSGVQNHLRGGLGVYIDCDYFDYQCVGIVWRKYGDLIS